MAERLYIVKHRMVKPGRSHVRLVPVMARNEADAYLRAGAILGDTFREGDQLEAVLTHVPKGYEIVPAETIRALRALTGWCVSKFMSPHTIPAIKRALKAVAKFQGIKWRDAVASIGAL